MIVPDKQLDHVSLCVCGGDSIVTDSRDTTEGRIRRRRECLKCGMRWTTYEMRRERPAPAPNITSDLEQLAEIRAFHTEAIRRIDEVLNRVVGVSGCTAG